MSGVECKFVVNHHMEVYLNTISKGESFEVLLIVLREIIFSLKYDIGAFAGSKFEALTVRSFMLLYESTELCSIFLSTLIYDLRTCANMM